MRHHLLNDTKEPFFGFESFSFISHCDRFVSDSCLLNSEDTLYQQHLTLCDVIVFLEDFVAVALGLLLEST